MTIDSSSKIGGLLPTIIKETSSLALLTEKDLVGAFIKKFELKLASDCTKLPAPLGFFPLRSELLEAMKQEHFYITEDRDGIVKVSDTTSIATRKFNSQRYPQLWVWPTISVDHKEKRVVCVMTCRVSDQETFPMTVSHRLCRAVAAVYTECHPFIREIATTGSAGVPWSEVGLGPIMSLAEAFQYYVYDKPVRWALAKAKLGIFSPDPLEPKFVQNGDHWLLRSQWLEQGEAFKMRF
jgi:hypothetical protein